MSGIIYSVIRIVWLIVLLAVIAGIVIFLIIRSFVKKNAKIASDEDSDYSDHVNREDISSYIAFDDIRDGIVSLQNGKKHVAAIEIQGYDLFHASDEDQNAVMNNYTRFIDMLPDNEFLQVRYNPVTRDLSGYIVQYQSLYEQVCERLYEKLETINRLQNTLNKASVKDISLISEKIISLNKEVESLQSQKKELNELVRWLKFNSDEDLNPDLRSTYVFSHSNDNIETAFEENLTDEQIFERAKSELTNVANSYIRALEDAHLHVRMVTRTERMVDLFRSYFRPITGMNYTVSDLLKSNALEYVVDSERDMQDIGKIYDDSLTNARLAEARQDIIKERREREEREKITAEK